MGSTWPFHNTSLKKCHLNDSCQGREQARYYFMLIRINDLIPPPLSSAPIGYYFEPT